MYIKHLQGIYILHFVFAKYENTYLKAPPHSANFNETFNEIYNGRMLQFVDIQVFYYIYISSGWIKFIFSIKKFTPQKIESTDFLLYTKSFLRFEWYQLWTDFYGASRRNHYANFNYIYQFAFRIIEQ